MVHQWLVCFNTGWQWLMMMMMMMVIDNDWRRCFTMVDNYPLHGECMGLWWLIVVHGLLSLIISWYSGTDWLEVPTMYNPYMSGLYLRPKHFAMSTLPEVRWFRARRWRLYPRWSWTSPLGRSWRCFWWTFLNVGSVGDMERLRISNPGKVGIFQGVLRMFQFKFRSL